MRILSPPWGIFTAPKTLAKLISATGFLLSSATVFAQNPSPPDDLRYKVYSNTATEIFWKRATDSDGSVVGYEIQLNGEVIGTLDVLSYYFDNLVPDQAYDVVVTTIDNEGDRSSSATVSFIGGDLSTPILDDPGFVDLEIQLLSQPLLTENVAIM